MPLYTRREFAQACGVSDAYLHMNINRRKVFLREDGMIDPAEKYNADFMAKRLAGKNIVSQVPDPEPIAEKEEPEPEEIHPEPEKLQPNTNIKASKLAQSRIKQEPPKPKDKKTPVTVSGNSKSDDLYDLDKRIKTQELIKKESETRLLVLKEEKIRGEVIPILLVKQLFNSFSQATMTANKDGLEALLINISKEMRMSGEQLSILRGKMVKILNDSALRANASAKNSIKTIVAEYSQSRTVGEHD